MNTKQELQQILSEIEECSDKLQTLIKKRNELQVRSFYEQNHLKEGQPFMCKGKKIVKVQYNSVYSVNGFYITKLGMLSLKPLIIWDTDHIEPLPME